MTEIQVFIEKQADPESQEGFLWKEELKRAITWPEGESVYLRATFRCPDDDPPALDISIRNCDDAEIYNICSLHLREEDLKYLQQFCVSALRMGTELKETK